MNDLPMVQTHLDAGRGGPEVMTDLNGGECLRWNLRARIRESSSHPIMRYNLTYSFVP
jgi:hypothetical protein